MKYSGYIVALVFLFGAILFVRNFESTESRKVERLRHQVNIQGRRHEAKLEHKNQRLAAVLSHLEANPLVKAPGNHQSLIGPYAKMEWQYSATENGVDQSSLKHSIYGIQNTRIILKDVRGGAIGEVAMELQDGKNGTSASPYSPKHSIIELRNAANPLQDTKAAMVAGEAAWYPITLSKKVDKPGVYLWRVIEGEFDSSDRLRAEGSWGPYSVFSIYPSVYERILKTKKIIVGAYNVEQVKLEEKDEKPETKDGKDCVKRSAGLSEDDTKVLCSVLEVMGIPDLEPVVKRYSDIDHKLLPALKAGELDIAFGDISNARYRSEKGIQFLEYKYSRKAMPIPMLLTNDNSKNEIGVKDKICTVRGTVYQHVLESKEEYKSKSEACQNAFDAIDRLYKDDIQWVVMGSQTWNEINVWNKTDKPKVFENTTSRLLIYLRNSQEIKGDAFAIIDEKLYCALESALKKKGLHGGAERCQRSS